MCPLCIPAVFVRSLCVHSRRDDVYPLADARRASTLRHARSVGYARRGHLPDVPHSVAIQSR